MNAENLEKYSRDKYSEIRKLICIIIRDYIGKSRRIEKREEIFDSTQRYRVLISAASDWSDPDRNQIVINELKALSGEQTGKYVPMYLEWLWANDQASAIEAIKAVDPDFTYETQKVALSSHPSEESSSSVGNTQRSLWTNGASVEWKRSFKLGRVYSTSKSDILRTWIHFSNRLMKHRLAPKV